MGGGGRGSEGNAAVPRGHPESAWGDGGHAARRPPPPLHLLCVPKKAVSVFEIIENILDQPIFTRAHALTIPPTHPRTASPYDHPTPPPPLPAHRSFYQIGPAGAAALAAALAPLTGLEGLYLKYALAGGSKETRRFGRVTRRARGGYGGRQGAWGTDGRRAGARARVRSRRAWFRMAPRGGGWTVRRWACSLALMPVRLN